MNTQPNLPARYQLGEHVMVTMTVKAIRFTEQGYSYDLGADSASGQFAVSYHVGESIIHPLPDTDHGADLEGQPTAQGAVSVSDEEFNKADAVYDAEIDEINTDKTVRLSYAEPTALRCALESFARGKFAQPNVPVDSLTRYELDTAWDSGLGEWVPTQMVSSSDGTYVLYRDIKQLIAERDAEGAK